MSLDKKFAKYTRRNRILKLDYLADEWGCSISDITTLICENIGDFGNVIFEDMALHLDYPDTNQWWYEYAKGFKNKEGDHHFKRHIHGKMEEVDEMYHKYKDKKDRHISVFAHDNKWKKKFNDPNSKVRAPFIYLELDRSGDLDLAMIDANRFLEQFPYHQGVQTWFSGNSSVHIGVPSVYFGCPIATNTKGCGRGKLYYNLARMIGGRIRFDNDFFDPHLSAIDDCEEMYKEMFNEEPPNDPQLVRQKLEHFDPNLFYMNSMIRMPGSVHEKSGNAKEFIELPAFDPDNSPEPKPYLLSMTYGAWDRVRKPGRKAKQIDVRGYESFVISYFIEHIADFDPDAINSAGWVHSLPSPFYDDNNPDVSVCVDPESDKFGSFRDFGNEDDNTDFVGFVSRIIKKSRRAALDYIRAKS